MTTELRELRRNRDLAASVVEGRILVIENRQLVLRRLVDSILFVMIQEQNWLLRRFTRDLQIHKIDPAVLARTTRTAVERNAADRLKFNLVSDLSTVVQIGDLIEVDASVQGAGKWRVIELKEGKMNEVLSGLLEQEKSSGSAAMTITRTLGEKAAKQAGRMVKQVRRMEELKRIVETDRGLDPMHEVETTMTPDAVTLENYYDEIEQAHERAKKNGAAAIEISGCLRIFGITEEVAKGRARDAARYQLRHLSAADGKIEAAPYFVNIVDYILNVPIADPIFVWPNRDVVFDLVMSRVHIFVQFDLKAFFRYAQKQDIKMRFVEGKEAEDAKKLSMRIPGTDDAWGIHAELPSGHCQTLLSGFLCRPYSNLVTPHQLIEMIKRMPEQLARADPDGKLESAT